MHVELDGQVWRIVEFQHVKPGKGGAFVRTKLKSSTRARWSTGRSARARRCRASAPRRRESSTSTTRATRSSSWTTRTTSRSTLRAPSSTGELPYMQPSSAVLLLLVNGKAVGVDLPGVGRARRDRDRARRQGRHGLDVTQARHARDRSGRPGAAVRERRRPHQGRHARGALHLPGLGCPHTRRHEDPASLAGAPCPADADLAVLELAEILDTAGFATSRFPAAAASTQRYAAASKARGSGSARSVALLDAARDGAAGTVPRRDAPTLRDLVRASCQARPRTASTSSGSTIR